MCEGAIAVIDRYTCESAQLGVRAPDTAVNATRITRFGHPPWQLLWPASERRQSLCITCDWPRNSSRTVYGVYKPYETLRYNQTHCTRRLMSKTQFVLKWARVTARPKTLLERPTGVASPLHAVCRCARKPMRHCEGHSRWCALLEALHSAKHAPLVILKAAFLHSSPLTSCSGRPHHYWRSRGVNSIVSKPSTSPGVSARIVYGAQVFLRRAFKFQNCDKTPPSW